MERGDLSNRLPPRWLFVYEGVVGTLPSDKVAEFKLAYRLGRHKRAVRCWQTEPHVQKVLWDLTWRRDYRFDLVTFLGDGFAEALEVALTRESIPFSNVWAVDEETLARRLAVMPDVQYVIHGDPARHLTYGNKGLLVTDPNKLVLF